MTFQPNPEERCHLQNGGQAVDAIQDTAMHGQQVAAILDAGLAFQRAFEQVTQNGKPEQTPEQC